MSVPKAKRGEGRLEVLTKALELADYTRQVCKSEKTFPKRDRWLLTQRIVSESLEIAMHIRKGNTIRVERESDFLERRQHQQEAMESCEWLLTLVDMAYRDPDIGVDGKRAEYWTGLVLEVERLISGWRKADRDAWRKKQVSTPKGG